jgi:RNA polymerase sigma-70 factor (ECF subfamily)
VLRFVHRLTGDRHEAEDVAHEAFLRLLRTPRAVARPGPWLFQVAANLVRDGRRRASARWRGERRIAGDASAARPDRPDEELERAEDVRRVRDALDALAPRDREVLLMREAGFGYAEIAEVLGVQPQSVPTVVMRALRRFRTAYADAHEPSRS